VDSALHVHLVVVTTFRRGVPGAGMPQRCQDTMDGLRGLRRGAAGAQRPRRSRAPAGRLPAQGGHLRTGEQPQRRAGPAAAKAVHQPGQPAHHARALLVPALPRRIQRRRPARHHPAVHRTAKASGYATSGLTHP